MSKSLVEIGVQNGVRLVSSLILGLREVRTIVHDLQYSHLQFRNTVRIWTRRTGEHDGNSLELQWRRQCP